MMLNINNVNTENAAYLFLTSEVIKRCLTKLVYGDTPEARIDFAKNSRLIDMFCDCTDNFEADKLRNEIIKFNKNL